MLRLPFLLRLSLVWQVLLAVDYEIAFAAADALAWWGQDKASLFPPKHPHSWFLVLSTTIMAPTTCVRFMWLEGTQIDGGPREAFKVEPKCWALPVHKIKSLTGVQTRKDASILDIRKDVIHRIKV